MEDEYIVEPKDGLIKFGPEVMEFIRKEHNLSNKENREKAIAIVDEWIKQQDHFVKKDYSKGYIERTIATSKGSLELAKKQIDKICTMRTLIPKYFKITNLKKSEIMTIFDKLYIAILPMLTDEYYRVVIFKIRPNQVVNSANQYILLYNLIIILAEYMKANECCRGYIVIYDFCDTSAAGVLAKCNLLDIQQFVSILTQGYGCKIKTVLMVTESKFIEGFINLIKPAFSQKIGNRLHAVTTRKTIQDYVHGNILPEDYGGPEKPMKQLHDDFVESLSHETVQELLKEMNKAVTDESKRDKDTFNDQYMGMPGSFRTITLD